MHSQSAIVISYYVLHILFSRLIACKITLNTNLRLTLTQIKVYINKLSGLRNMALILA